MPSRSADGDVARAEGRAERAALRERWRAEGWYANTTLGAALAACADAHADDRLTFEHVGGSPCVRTLADVHLGARRAAGRLFAAGVRPGDRVIVQTAADEVGTEVLAALWILGAVAVPLVTTSSVDELAHVASETGATAMVAVEEWRGASLASVAVEHGAEWGVSTVLVPGSAAPIGATALDSLGDPSLPELPRPSPSEVACILYTSGSTGMPKGVQHSHETLLVGLNAALPVSAASRSLTSFPSGHVASIIGLLRPLTSGGTTIVMDRWSASTAAAIIEEHRITTSAGTPFYLATLLDEAERARHDISSLRLFLVGAATVSPALVERADDAGIITWRSYGSTEHPTISSGVPDDPRDRRCSTDGRPTPGNEVRIVDAGGDVEPGAEGEIVSRGPRQFLGYRDASLDAEAFRDSSWFHTGDVGRFDGEYLVVTDRIKDIIIRGGENISAREVEDAIARLGGIEEVAVCAAPDEVWGESVFAFVRAQPAVAVDLADIRAALAEAGLPAHKLPAGLSVVDEFPRTAAGKIKKRELRDQLSPPAPG